MNSLNNFQLQQFFLVYILLIIVMFILKKCGIDKNKLLVMSSLKMSIQLVLAGLVLTYIFENPHPMFTIAYLISMITFTIYRVISKNKQINKQFKIIIAISISFSGLFVILYFIYVVVSQSIFNPQYIIPISGMIMGNTMNGVSLGIKTFNEALEEQEQKINALLSFGATPSKILHPIVKQALETAMLPTLNSMVGMGIVSLPGMMTGQILAGTVPTTAILYQISIMIAICTAVTCSCFGSLYFGVKTLYDKDTQIIL